MDFLKLYQLEGSFTAKKYQTGAFCPEIVDGPEQFLRSLRSLYSDYCHSEQKKIFPFWFITNVIDSKLVI